MNSPLFKIWLLILFLGGVLIGLHGYQLSTTEREDNSLIFRIQQDSETTLPDSQINVTLEWGTIKHNPHISSHGKPMP